MRVRLILNFLTISIVMALVGCASTPGTNAHRILLTQDVMVTEGAGAVQLKKAGETIDVKNEPVLIEAEGFAGVLVVPTLSESSKITVKLQPLEKFGGPLLASLSNVFMDRVFTKIYEIQVLLAGGRIDEALLHTDSLIISYPQITQLYVLKASCLTLKGNVEGAKMILKGILEKNPEHTGALALFKALKGQMDKVGTGLEKDITTAVTEDLNAEAAKEKLSRKNGRRKSE